MAERLRPDDHLCGHSYGAVVSLFAAEVARDLRSLTVIEPPAFGFGDPRSAGRRVSLQEPQEPAAQYSFCRSASARDEGVGASPP